MNALGLSQGYAITTLAIVDDDRDAAITAQWQVEDAGYQPFVVEDSFDDIDVLVKHVIENAQGALCDHRLTPRGLANFYGAALVAALFDRCIPAILTTQYAGIDADVSIRKWRDRIPVLLSSDETDALAIRTGIEACVAELHGNVPSTRRPHRVLLRIAAISEESGEEVVDAVIPSWNPRRAVRFPASLIPGGLRDELAPDTRLFALVNIGAESSEDLYLRQFESATEPDTDDGLA
jgi:hypothetical protein